MTPQEAIKEIIQSGEMIFNTYFSDLTDEELLIRPHPQMNHINWQIGHLICSENFMVNSVHPHPVHEISESFREKYSRNQAACDDIHAFATKAELQEEFQKQRKRTLEALSQTSTEDLDRESGLSYAPTIASVYLMQGAHWLMHSGQWVIVRRQLGKPAVF